MRIAVYGDVHLTKNMRNLQEIWNVSAMESIYHMYDDFDSKSVELAVCLGDFFDAPRIEAKSMNLVLPILDTINHRTYPTYILLGNHEADSSESNILDFLGAYENIIPITSLTEIEDMLFIPYYEDPSKASIKSHHIVFTHHDIYGAELASGKTKAFFGIDPSIFKEAKLVMNGHVHLKSKVTTNLINTGSLLVSQQGELRVGEYPSYYILDTRSGEYVEFTNKYSMIYQSIDITDIEKISGYDKSKLVLRVDYEEEIPDSPMDIAHISFRKKIESIDGKVDEIVVRTSNFDMKNYLVEYLKSDLPEEFVEDYISTGLELLS